MKNYIPTESRALNGGIQKLFRFANGYGASVVRHNFSYGHQDGLWELAVIGKHGRLCYTTPITENVVGYLTDEGVQEILAKIEALPE